MISQLARSLSTATSTSVRTFETVAFATLTWFDWFNNRRLLEPIGSIPPAEAEERYYAMLDEPAMPALLKRNRLRETRRGSIPFATLLAFFTGSGL